MINFCLMQRLFKRKHKEGKLCKYCKVKAVREALGLDISSTTAWNQYGTWNYTGLGGSIPLPTGAAIAANQSCPKTK